MAYLDAVRPHFPPGLRQIDESYYLHDAIIHGLGRRGPFLVMILQLDTPPQSILTFTYDLVDEPVIVKDVLPQKGCDTGSIVEWRYNEIEKVPGNPPTWRESLLLSNGWELVLHFRDVRVDEIQAVFPAPGTVLPEAFGASRKRNLNPRGRSAAFVATNRIDEACQRRRHDQKKRLACDRVRFRCRGLARQSIPCIVCQ